MVDESLTLTVSSLEILNGLKTNLIDNYRYVLPQFQRGFDWEIEDVKNLLYSSFASYPIGAILTWNHENKGGDIIPVDLRDKEQFDENCTLDLKKVDTKKMDSNLLFILAH